MDSALRRLLFDADAIDTHGFAWADVTSKINKKVKRYSKILIKLTRSFLEVEEKDQMRIFNLQFRAERGHQVILSRAFQKIVGEIKEN